MSSNHTYVAIMAGGVGSRFWPASREARPKQFLDILGVGKSLLRMTFERFLHLCPAEHIFIVTNAMYYDQVKAQLPELTDNQILLEPSRNNTAPCIAYTAFKLQQLDPEANFVVAPSDHIITNEASFVKSLQLGLDFAAKHDALLTLGIRPSRPDTGYGYINFESVATNEGIHKVKRFTEKPPLEKAEQFVVSGDYLWNAGIFIWSVRSILASLQKNATEIYDILKAGGKVYNSPEEQAFIDEKYPTTPDISIDFAVMEKADNVYTIPAAFGWSDLGTWASLHAELAKGEHQNTINASENMLNDVKNCLVRAPKDKLVVIKGLEDFIIVDEEDVLLIYPMSSEQEIKKVTQKMKIEGRTNYL